MIATHSAAPINGSLDTFDPAGVSLDDLEAELARLAAVNAELLAAFGGGESVRSAFAISVPREKVESRLDDSIRRIGASTSATSPDSLAVDERTENAMLRDRVTELETELAELNERLMEVSTPANISLQGDLDDFTQLQDDLESERKQLQAEREEWQNQMREVELNMAKERAELARLRSDLQRQQAEIERALENTGWDPELKQKLVSFQRRPDAKGSRPVLDKPQEPAAASPAPSGAKKNSSGIFRRLFGGA